MKTIAAFILSITFAFSSVIALAQPETKAQSQPALYENKELGVSFKIRQGWTVGDDAAKQAYAQAAQMKPSQKLLLLLTRKQNNAPTERITLVAYLFGKGVHPTLDSAEQFMKTWAVGHPDYEREEESKPEVISQTGTQAPSPSASASARFNTKSGQERWVEIYATQARDTFFRVIGEFNSESSLREAKMSLRIVPDWQNPNEQLFEKVKDEADVVPSPVRVPQTVTQGKLIKKVPPTYPEQARRLRIEGQVVLVGVISKRGKVAELTIVYGEPSLVGSAMQAVKQWEYKPYLVNGEAVDVETQITVNFKLQ